MIILYEPNIHLLSPFFLLHSFFFLPSSEPNWLYFYSCTTSAMELGVPGVKGYLTLGDDVLLNTWNIVQLDRNRMWMPEGVKKHNLTHETDRSWFHLDKWYGRPAFRKAVRHLKNAAVFGDSSAAALNETIRNFTQFSKRFLKHYEANVGGLDILVRHSMDFFYVPEIFKYIFLMACEVFRTQQCFVEVALPAIFHGLALSQEVTSVVGADLWGQKRVFPWKFYSLDNIYTHPFKLLRHLNFPKSRKCFCERHLKRYINFINGT